MYRRALNAEKSLKRLEEKITFEEVKEELERREEYVRQKEKSIESNYTSFDELCISYAVLDKKFQFAQSYIDKLCNSDENCLEQYYKNQEIVIKQGTKEAEDGWAAFITKNNFFN